MLEVESDDLFRATFEKITAGMVVVDTEGMFLRVNPAFCKFLGYTEDELLKLRLLDVTHLDDRARIQQNFNEVVAGLRQSIDVQKRCIRKDGAIVWVRATAVCLRDEHANPIYCVAVMQDITEYQQAEERFRLAVESAPNGMAMVNEEGRIILVNSQTERMFGYSREELLGQSVEQLLPERFRHGHPAYRAGFAAAPQARPMGVGRDLYGRRKDGSEFPVEIGLNPIETERGFWVLSSIVDITERKRTEAALRESEAYFRAVAESSIDAMVATDSAGRISSWNPAAQRMFQYTEEEILGQPLTVIMPDRYREAYQEGMQRYQQTGISRYIGRTMELHGQRKDGSEFPVEVSLSSWKTERDEFYHGIMRDTTERKQAEEQLRNSSEQLRALTAHLQSVREEEATRIAREIHDELSPALTALMMDLSWLAGRLTEDQQLLHEKIGSMSKLTDTTIRSVRKIATELRPGVLDDIGLAAAIEWQAQEFQARAGIRCKISAIPRAITLDPNQSTAIFRIFQEILTNVARHSRASKVNISLEEKTGNLTLEVRDNGKGIAESEISSPKSVGLLGMRERALLFGGEVKISGASGEGTVVTVRIPL